MVATVATTVAFAVSVAAVAKVLLFPQVGHSAIVHLFVAFSFSADNNNNPYLFLLVVHFAFLLQTSGRRRFFEKEKVRARPSSSSAVIQHLCNFELPRRKEETKMRLLCTSRTVRLEEIVMLPNGNPTPNT